MLNSATAVKANVKANPTPTPKVLLQAKKEVVIQTSEKARIWDKGPWDKGPWDKGHWANRK